MWVAGFALVVTVAADAGGRGKESATAGPTLPTGGTVAIERRHSNDMMTGGIAVTGAGLLVVVGGMLATASGTCGFGLAPSGCTTDQTVTDVGTGFIVAGSLSAATGVVLALAGASVKPTDEHAACAPTLQLGPTGGAMTWSF